MSDVLALINLHLTPKLGGPIENWELASTTFMGRYTFIDGPLSHLHYANITNIGVLVKDHYRAIAKHISKSSIYLTNTKVSSLELLMNEKGLKNPQYNTDVNNLIENDYILYDSNAKYVVIVPTNFIMSPDYNELIDAHIKANRNVSIVYYETSRVKDFLEEDKLKVNNFSIVSSFSSVKGDEKSALVSTHIYIVNMDFLRKVLNEAKSYSSLATLEDLFKVLTVETGEMNAIKYSGFVYRVASLRDYFAISLMSLDNGYFENKNVLSLPLLTKTHNTTPVLYGENCKVSDSIVANGCEIDGCVKHSIIARNVIIEDGAVVENSILLSHTVVKKGVHLNNVVSDKRVVFENKKDVHGYYDNPLYIGRGEKI